MFRVFRHLLARRYFDTHLPAGQRRFLARYYRRANALPINTLEPRVHDGRRTRDPDSKPDDRKAEDSMLIDRKTISIMKACELVGVSRRTIYNWIASGKVEYVRTAGGSVRIFVDTLWREPGRAPDLTRPEAS
jgi:excisionase family DNA binding protein